MLPQVLLSTLGFLGKASCSQTSGHGSPNYHQCPELPKGDLIYDVYMGYPENFMWDKRRCVAYVSNLYNASLSIYDPYESRVLETFQFPGLSHPGNSAIDNPLHTSGLVLRPDSYRAETLEIVVDNGDAFFSNGLNVSGPDYLLTMDLSTKEITHQLHLNNGLYAGYADAELGTDGNTYVLGTYTANILRVTPDKKLSTFYVEKPLAPPRLYGFTGITHVGDTLIANNNIIGQFVRFSVHDDEGTPIIIKQTPYHNFTTSNVLNLPEKYEDTILLATENATPEHPSGGVGVFRSQDKLFHEMEFLGFIPSRLNQALATSARQMADRIYVVSVYTDGANITVAGHTSKFVFQDFTEEIDALVNTQSDEL
ncbi:Tri14 [Stachybotrys chartarum IBT 7711]|uniref:Tri14 n=1 Tax=Stachybotrys chartarum (strain CBS 109288 / IBT 7711) TaxID=1280523 RepID=A0A084AFG5_STACB|nr:Tri14 [Stachybotrys chartarum IBT 7711]